MSREKFANANADDFGPVGHGIIQRVKQMRQRRFGPRGQARFAAVLGISPSTYNYYEKSRVPPAHLLVRMAEVAEVDLMWLLTGRSRESLAGGEGPAVGEGTAERLADLLGRRPGAEPALLAFAELLERVDTVEQQRRLSAEPQRTRQILPMAAAELVRAGAADRRPARPIPVLGRTAAGVPRFWVNEKDRQELARQMDQAIEMLKTVQGLIGSVASVAGEVVDQAVALVQLSDAVAFAGLSIDEAIDAPALAERWPDAFALRVDGESMLPWLEPDDLIVLSPAVSATDGDLAVVQLGDQVGVTCKIFRTADGSVRLIPLNPEYPTTIHRVGSIVWALRVLARIQIG